ncbi:hemolytic protein HlpA [Polymorphobacter multimanifer]|uniref:Glycosyltransferase family 2 protein n=1 Tax=Polymorphobacter multimanifer TaxID=1070431 RepID=A0A841L9P7_9SPHN|nr:glycosyltransferase family 2 protein [Polymorphobacter multimanifer]MBB6226565.1 hypothetical protein [Polymorphobacter multimanifer]GGI79872.1 hemolytic protein HlpA [Polymorphobacter multimanifer]
MRSPVLLIVFNRPEKTAAVMERLRAARPPKLYVAADGPRPSRAGEAERCAAVRSIATGVDWPCDVHTLFRDANLGCKHGVAGAIDWFFAHEPEGIILEDDILPTPDFFAFCDDQLERHRDDPQVGMIGGINLVASHLPADGASWGYTGYPQIWGWASWRRAWAHFDVALSNWPAVLPAFRAGFGRRQLAADMFIDRLGQVASGSLDTWDYQWVLACRLAGMSCVLPSVSLVENIGFDAEATHTIGEAPAAVRAQRPAPLAFPLTPPQGRDTDTLDRLLERHSFDLTAATWLRLQIRKRPWLARPLKRLRAAMA